MQQRSPTRSAARLPVALALALLSGAFSLGSAPVPVQPADPDPARVTFETEDKLTLVATYYAPRDTKQKAPGAVLVHDAGGSRNDLQQLAARLQKSGFAVLTLDLRGHGESATQELTWKQLDDDGQTRAWAIMPRDLKAGVDFLTSQTGVHSATVSLLGQRAGAALVARHAVRDEKVRDLAMIDPRPEVLGFSLVKDLEQLGGLPTLVVVGKGDQNAGKELSQASARAAGSAEWIDVKVAKQESASLLTDKAMYGDVAKWMLEKAVPSKTRE